jgi:hypothetical protein
LLLIIFGSYPGRFTSFFIDKKDSQNSRNQGFSYDFSMMMEGSGSRWGGGERGKFSQKCASPLAKS